MTEPSKLTHVDGAGRARMVDVGPKPVTERRAVAEGRVTMAAALVQAIREHALPKGDLLEVARIAGIQAAKQTPSLIPLCHPLPLEFANVDVELSATAVHIRAEVRATAKTGVEMEALTAVAVAALTVVDMGKSIDPGMVIGPIRLLEKSGGVRGPYRARPLGEASSP